MMTRFSTLMAALLLVPVYSVGADVPAEREPRPKAQEVADFRLLDYRGRHHELHRADGKLVVLFIAGNGCPIVRQSAAKLRVLRRKFAKQGVVFWMLNANPQDDRASVA